MGAVIDDDSSDGITEGLIVRPILSVGTSGLTLHALRTVGRGCRLEAVLTQLASSTSAIPPEVSLYCGPAGDRRTTAALLRQLLAFPKAHRAALRRLILHVPATRMSGVAAERLQALRAAGVRIATGVRVSTPIGERLRRIDPDYLRVGPGIVGGCAERPTATAALGRIVAQAWDMGASVLASGISDLRDLQAVGRCGVRLFEGGLFGPPTGVRQVVASRFASWRVVAAESVTARPVVPDSEEGE